MRRQDGEGIIQQNTHKGTARLRNFSRLVWEFRFSPPPYVKNGRHACLVSHLVSAGFAEYGFRQAVTRAMSDYVLPPRVCAAKKCLCSVTEKQNYASDMESTPSCLWQAAKEEGLWVALRHIPDAWKIFPEEKLVVVVEVDVAHPAGHDKYADTWEWLDADCWSLAVTHCDRYGTLSTPHDFQEAWHQRIRDEIDLRSAIAEI